MQKFFRYFLVVLIAFFIGRCTINLGNSTNPPKAQLAQAAVPGSKAELIEKDQGSSTITRAVDKLGPAVVNINTLVQQEVSPGGFQPFMNDPFFRQFFGEDFMKPKTVPQKGQGSGVIVRSDGYILTNQHVVENAKEIEVTLIDKRSFKGRVIGQDRYSDIAVIKIEANNLPFAELGDSSAVKVGEWVIAIGNPFGYQNTVTVGVLSGRGRTLNGDFRHYEGLLQTDAAINPGNSGGPLADLTGKVIGINTAINPMAQGIGFAIPVNLTKDIMAQLIDKGRVERAGQSYLGILMRNVSDLSPDAREYLRFTGNQGILVENVIPKSPAEKAGLLRGDIILEIDRQKITDAENLRKIISQCKVGQKINLVVWRGGKQGFLKATLGQKPEELYR